MTKRVKEPPPPLACVRCQRAIVTDSPKQEQDIRDAARVNGDGPYCLHCLRREQDRRLAVINRHNRAVERESWPLMPHPTPAPPQPPPQRVTTPSATPADRTPRRRRARPPKPAP